MHNPAVKVLRVENNSQSGVLKNIHRIVCIDRRVAFIAGALEICLQGEKNAKLKSRVLTWDIFFFSYQHRVGT